jgi:Rap1a immunity proteins
MMRRKGSERGSGPFLSRPGGGDARGLTLLNYVFVNARPLWNNLTVLPFSFAEAHEWLEVGRFSAALSSVSRRSTPPQCRRKLELMMRHGSLAGCHDAIRSAGQPQSFDAVMCLGIIKGLHYLSRDVCIPPSTSLAEIADIVSRYVDSRKGSTQDDFRETSLEAMRSGWPCGKRNDI